MAEAKEDSVRCEYEGTVIYVPKNVFLMMTLRMQYPEKKFIRYKEGAVLYSMSQREFDKLAHNAGAVYKVNKMALVKVDLVDRFLEYFKE